MKSISVSDLRNTLSEAIDAVENDHEPLLVTRNGTEKAVLLSSEDYRALEETAYLLRSPKNAERLLSAIKHLSEGAAVTFTIPE